MRERFLSSNRGVLCSRPNLPIKAEAIPDALKLFPLPKKGVINKTVFSGEHYFYINDSGKP